MSAGAVKRKIADISVSNVHSVKKQKWESPGKHDAQSTYAKGKPSYGKKEQLNSSNSSKEAHAKQKALALERKAAKPNADSIQRAKQLWERLRRKSHVAKEERDQLVEELYGIISGQVKDFVFKHDSVRVVQCALKYANAEQCKMIAQELKGEYRALAESRYAKFLVAKLLVQGDDETKEWIIKEFYGGVKKLINHPEASWILDDTYRGAATPTQKAKLLREWYDPEYAIFKDQSGKEKIDAELSKILAASPEKRSSTMKYLQGMINQLVQKKMTAFTMLHDAMLQYFLNTTPGTEEANEFLELLKGDEEGDLLKNLAFTKSGAKLVCFALAYGNAKDRKNILKVYKDNIETLAYDVNGHLVLLAAYDLVDDTVMTSKLIFPELLGTKLAAENQHTKIFEMANHMTARIPLLYPFAVDSTPGKVAKWLIPAGSPTSSLLNSLHETRSMTSKKDPEVRRKELLRAMCDPPVLLSAITAKASELLSGTLGCQFVTEVLLDAEGDKTEAMKRIASLAGGDPNEEGHLAASAAAGRMWKTLVLGGRFNAQKRAVIPAEPPLGFANILYAQIKDHLIDWSVGASSFVVVGLLESAEFKSKQEVLTILKKKQKLLKSAAEKKNKGAEILLEKL